MKKQDEKMIHDPGSGQRTQTQKKMIIQELKARGGRMTKQRRMLLDIILEDECSSCKEIYYRSVSRGEKVGLATVYRLVNALEEMGAINRKNMYKVICGDACDLADGYTVAFDDGTVIRLSAEKWYQVVRTGLKECGYLEERTLRSVSARAK